MHNRIVITGLGVVSSIGIGKDEFWQNLIAGKSGISQVELFDTSDMPRHHGGEIKDFDFHRFSPRNIDGAIGRAPQLAIAATKLALRDSRVSWIKGTAGMVIGTTNGQMPILETINKFWVDSGEEDVNHSWIFNISNAHVGSYVSKEFFLNGLSVMMPTACSAGNYALGYAYDLLKLNKVDMMLAGGVDAFSKVAFTGFQRLFAMSEGKCRPFDKNRDGMIVGEGAAILVLERLPSALRRKATIYAEILGYGLSCDAHHMTQPNVEGVKSCMRKAMREAQVEPKEVDYICAHGTATPQNDKAESAAIKEIFDTNSRPPASSIKSMLGHTMGAASAIETVACCLAMQNNIIPPTINYETPDPECDIDCVPNVARKKRLDVVLNNSCAFGGNNACVVLRKVKDTE